LCAEIMESVIVAIGILTLVLLAYCISALRYMIVWIKAHTMATEELLKVAKSFERFI
jgi:uncharacterized membrane protein YdbT with pleckstrin-like domain